MQVFLIRNFWSLIIVFFLCGSLSAQENDSLSDSFTSDAVNTNAGIVRPLAATYSAIDSYVFSLKKHYKNIPELAADLTRPFSTDEEKVRAIFIWITSNINYDCAEYHSHKSMTVKFKYKSQEDLDKKRQVFYDNYAANVLKKGKGICEGYAVLFQHLCKESGIQCDLVVGRVSGDIKTIERIKGKKNFATNHTWDKVKIGDSWYYLDPTWASGFCDKGVKKYYKNYNEYYYLTPLTKLYKTHAENEKQTEEKNVVTARFR
jgi:transglutaminase/protease-like cytokinesis protein 3